MILILYPRTEKAKIHSMQHMWSVVGVVSKM